MLNVLTGRKKILMLAYFYIMLMIIIFKLMVKLKKLLEL